MLNFLLFRILHMHCIGFDEVVSCLWVAVPCIESASAYYLS